MLLDQTLNFLSYIIWLIFLVYLAFTVVRAFQYGRLNAVLKSLTSGRIILGFLIALGINLLSWSLIFIQPQEVGVVISLSNPNGFREQPLRSGLHIIIPLAETVKIYPISWQNYTMSSEPSEGEKVGDDSISARSADGQSVNLDSSIIYRLDPNEVIQLHIDFQDRYINDFIRPVLRGIVRTEVSQFNVDEINSSKRKDLESSLDNQLRTVLGEKGIILDRFLLRKISFSPLYSQAIELKQAAEQARIQKEYEAESIRKLAEGERDRLKLEAEGRSQAAILEGRAAAEVIRLKAAAEADAYNLITALLEKNPNLLTYRYIEKLGPAIKALLLPNNSPLLLPVPDLGLSEQEIPLNLNGTAIPPQNPTVTPTPTPTPVNP